MIETEKQICQSPGTFVARVWANDLDLVNWTPLLPSAIPRDESVTSGSRVRIESEWSAWKGSFTMVN